MCKGLVGPCVVEGRGQVNVPVQDHQQGATEAVQKGSKVIYRNRNLSRDHMYVEVQHIHVSHTVTINNMYVYSTCLWYFLIHSRIQMHVH